MKVREIEKGEKNERGERLMKERRDKRREMWTKKWRKSKEQGEFKKYYNYSK